MVNPIDILYLDDEDDILKLIKSLLEMSKDLRSGRHHQFRIDRHGENGHVALRRDNLRLSDA